MRSFPAPLLILPFLAGCLSMGEAPVPGGIYRLQSPGNGPRFDEWVMVKVVSEDATHEFILQAGNDGIRQSYALLDPVGMVTLLAGSYDGETVLADGPLADAMPPALPLGAIQLLRWPVERVQAGLPGHLSASADAAGVRRLSRGGRVLISATAGDTTVIRREDPPLLVEIRKAPAK